MRYPFTARAAVSLLIASSMLAGCTAADTLTPPAGIDRATHVSSIRRSSPPQPAEVSVPRAHARATVGRDPAPSNVDYLDTPNLAGLGHGAARNPIAQDMPSLPQAQDTPIARSAARPVTLGHPETTLGQQASALSDQGVNMDAGLGVAQAPEQGRVVGLAEAEEQDIAEGNTSEPLVDGIGSDQPVQLNQSPIPRSAAAQQMTLAPKREPGRQVAMLVRPQNPMTLSEGLADAPRDPDVMPASELQCRAELKRLGVVFQEKAPIYQGAACGIPHPVSLRGLSGDIAVKPAVTLNCQTTLAFAKWVKNELAPAARTRYWSGIGSIKPLGGYSCRRMNNSRQRYNPMSEHAHGNAIDIGEFTLKNGHQIDVRKKGLFSFREGGLLKAVRSDSCKYFNTVLGPGSNAEHANHFHFDLRERKGGRQYCD